MLVVDGSVVVVVIGIGVVVGFGVDGTVVVILGCTVVVMLFPDGEGVVGSKKYIYIYYN